MATSGNISFELNRDQLIARAYAKLGIPGEGNSLSISQIDDGAEALNSVVALAVADGMPLWKRTSLAATLSTTSQEYTIAGAVKVAAVFVVQDGGSQWEIYNKSLYDFNRLPTDSTGMPVHWTWAPSITGGTVSIWPLTSDSGTVNTASLKIIYQKEFDGFTAAGETMDFPAYWTSAIVYKTAQLLAPEHGVPLEDRKLLMTEAANYWKQASDYGDEDGSFYITPEKRC